MKFKSSLIGLSCFSALLIILTTSCKKAVEVAPPLNSLVSTNVYNSNATAVAVLTSLYSRMNAGTGVFASYNSLINGMQADELTLYYTGSVNYSQPYINAFLANGTVPFWSELYNYIYTTNVAIENISTSANLTPSVKNQLIGEAKFMRGFFYFYLTNLFGDVPLLTSSNYLTNALARRSSQALVYQQIIADLTDAQGLLSPNFVSSDAVTTTTERARPTKWAAAALLARVYLYTQDWVHAEAETDTVINNNNAGLISLYSKTNLNSVFLANSKEAIWQLRPVNPGFNTFDGNIFILTSAPSANSPVALSTNLINTFEANDSRKVTWIHDTTISGIHYYYPFKYKVKGGSGTPPVTEYLTVFRLAEQYLIRAEARAQQNNINGAQTDINTIRNRAGLTNTTAATTTDLLYAVYHERQVELFTEWGHRWLDLKRTKTIDAVMGAPGNVCQAKGGGTWNSTKSLLPIPTSDILSDQNLSQNSGY